MTSLLAVATDPSVGRAFNAALEGMKSSGKAFLPEGFLVASICVIVLLDLALPRKRSRSLAFVALLAIVGTGVLWFLRHDTHAILFSGLIAQDSFATFMQLLFLLGAAIVIALSYVYRDFEDKRMGEYYAILLSSVLGMFLAATANDLLMFAIALELVSIPSYILVVFDKKDRAATESGLKYILYGAFSSGIMLYGFSLLYGLTGSTRIADVSRFVVGNMDTFGVAAASLMAFAGFAYKMAAVPFHFWAPDVYQGAPTPITAFLAVSSKTAGFALFIRFLLATSPDRPLWGYDWLDAVAIFAAVTMTVGNLAALWQENMKRLLAYSSIAHAGYMLMGLVAVGTGTMEGFRAVSFYLAAYLYMTLGAFICVVAVYNLTGSESVGGGFRGLGRRAPWIAFSMTVFVISLIGLPPTVGFAGKFQLLAAAVTKGYLWLAVLAGVNTAISVYYYLRIVKSMYLDEPTVDPSSPYFELKAPGLSFFAFVPVIPTIVFGIYFEWIVAVTQSLEIIRG